MMEILYMQDEHFRVQVEKTRFEPLAKGIGNIKGKRRNCKPQILRSGLVVELENQ